MKRLPLEGRNSNEKHAPLHDLQVRDEILFEYFPLESETRLLEIGVGSGFTPFRLARQIRSITGVDVAAGNVATLVRTVTGRVSRDATLPAPDEADIRLAIQLHRLA